MAQTTYLLGAGVNRALCNKDGLQPPLTGDFFQQALRHPRVNNDWYLQRLDELFRYIEQYWHRSPTTLRERSFDLEECYTLIQLQLAEAQSARNEPAVLHLIRVYSALTFFFAEYLESFFDIGIHQGPFQLLAQDILRQRAAVLTFNYDTLLEQALENASGGRPGWTDLDFDAPEVPDEALPYSHHMWNPPLAYGVTFDDVQLHRAGVPVFVSGDRFYRHPANSLYDPPLLKLHGSVNWFFNTGQTIIPQPDDAPDRTGRTLVYRAHLSLGLPPLREAELLQPIIVTPTLTKTALEHPLLRDLWGRARRELHSTERLVIIGYSFPPADFHVRRLLREVFADSSPRELVVVNPDTTVVDIAKDLANFRRPVRICHDLVEYNSDASV